MFIFTPGGKTAGKRVGIPIPKLTFIPLFTSLAALLAIFYLRPWSLPPIGGASPRVRYAKSAYFTIFFT
jgi:hypothetical protein